MNIAEFIENANMDDTNLFNSNASSKLLFTLNYTLNQPYLPINANNVVYYDFSDDTLHITRFLTDIEPLVIDLKHSILKHKFYALRYEHRINSIIQLCLTGK